MAAPSLPLIERPDTNLTDLVLQTIRDGIVNQALPPGSRISEAKVAAQLRVSKTPVREALLRLRHVGLVEPCERGLRVVRPSIQAIREAYEFRAGSERTSAFYASNRADESERSRFVWLAQASLQAADAHDGAAFRQHDRDFHHGIAVASRNAILVQSVEDSLVLTSVLRERDIGLSHDSISCGRQHVEIARAILAGRSHRAGELMWEHVLHVMSLVLSVAPGELHPYPAEPNE
jgi:GntR family transcriptional regulator, rspAB operon transcriptional repressor